MARYIDADELLNKLPDVLPYKASVKRVLMQAPEADVVPKSEVERVYYNLQAVLEERAETKQEIAREIFRDVKKAIKEEVRDYCSGFERMETPEMQEYYKTKQNTAIYLYTKIDHLEKKYTEGK